jgi:hypothetical protein
LRQSGSGQNVFPQNLSGMRWSSLSIVQPIIRHGFLSVIVFQIDIVGIFAFEPKRDPPVVAYSHTPRANSIALQLMQTITWQVSDPLLFGRG